MIQQVIGDTLYSALMEVLDPEEEESKLPLSCLASISNDGPHVMISQRNGVAGNVNSKFFITHCPPDRLVLASKAGQKHIPDNFERLIGDTLFFFKDSPVRREEFKGLQSSHFFGSLPQGSLALSISLCEQAYIPTAFEQMIE